MDIDPLTVDWTFKSLVTLIFIYAVKVLTDLKISIEALNIKMAVVVEQISSHDKRIEKLENRGNK